MLVAEYPYPPRSGSQLRAVNIADALRLYGEVTTLSITGPEGGPEWRTATARFRHRRRHVGHRTIDVSSSLLRGQHAVLRRAESADLPAALEEEISRHQPSLVVLGKPFWGSFLDASAAADAVVIDADESIERADRSLFRSNARWTVRLRGLVEAPAARRLERRDLPRASEVWFSTTCEARSATDWLDTDLVRVVPNVARTDPGATPAPTEIAAIGFVGYYRHAPNEEAALELIQRVMPAVRTAGIALPLRLIGRDPTTAMLDAARGVTDVEITGEVEDPSAKLREAGVMVMPIRSGGGSRLKAIEAISAGVPIISTRFGVQGLNLTRGSSYLDADTPESFAWNIGRVAADLELRNRLVVNAYKETRSSHSHLALRSAVADSLSRLGLMRQR